MKKRSISLMAALLFSAALARGAEYQWSVVVPPEQGSKEMPIAYLWIPPGCQHVRGVVFAQHNMRSSRFWKAGLPQDAGGAGICGGVGRAGFDANFGLTRARRKVRRDDEGAGDQSGYRSWRLRR